MANNDALGPVDFVLLEFPEQNPSGSTARALLALVDAGVIQLYDIVALRRHDGGHEVFDLSEFDADGFARFDGARSGLLSDDDVAAAADLLQPGTIGVMLVYENVWASHFVGEARAAGGEMIVSQRVPAGDLLDTLDRLESN
ncbi:MAG: DUF6325 family protein [Actinomycetota bacterium]